MLTSLTTNQLNLPSPFPVGLSSIAAEGMHETDVVCWGNWESGKVAAKLLSLSEDMCTHIHIHIYVYIKDAWMCIEQIKYK